MLPCRLSICTEFEPRTSGTYVWTLDAAFLPCLRIPLLTQVSNAGDVLYVLPRGFRGNIAARSWRLRAEPAIKRVRPKNLHATVPAIATPLGGRPSGGIAVPTNHIGQNNGSGAARLLTPWRSREMGMCTALCPGGGRSKLPGARGLRRSARHQRRRGVARHHRHPVLG
jgi:hypothetical protein